MNEERVLQILKDFKEQEDLVLKHEIDESKEKLHVVLDLVEHEVELCFLTNPTEGIFRCENKTEEENIEKDDCETFDMFLEFVLEDYSRRRDKFIGLADSDAHSDLDSPVELTDSEEEDQEALDEIFEDNEINPLLLSVKVAKLVLGEDFCSIVDDIFQLRMTFPLSHLSNQIKRMYGINRTQQEISIKCRFTRQFLEDKTTVPQVIPSKKDPNESVFQYRLENIVRNFITNHWKNIKSENLKSLVEYSKLEHIRKKLVMSSEKIESLYTSLNKSNHVLLKCYLLFSNNMKIGSTLEHFEELIRKNHSMKILQQQELKMDENIIINEESFLKNFNESEIRELEENKNSIFFILKLYTFIMLRIEDLSPFCMLCDREIRINRSIKHNLKKKKSNKLQISYYHQPFLCTSSVCQFEYFDPSREIYKIISHPIISPSSVSSDIWENSMIVDLLLTFLYASCTSERKEIVFHPFPPHYISEFGGKRRYSALLECLNRIPSLENMKRILSSSSSSKKSSHPQKDDKEEEDVMETTMITSFGPKDDERLRLEIGEHPFILLEWLLTTARGIMVKIPVHKKIMSMKTNFQYMIDYNFPKDMKQFQVFKNSVIDLDDNSEETEGENENDDNNNINSSSKNKTHKKKNKISKTRNCDNEDEEEDFENMKQKYGSFFGFHGSHLSNWHSILKRGLQIGTGTKLETTGSAYGSGIYLSPNSSEAIGYAGCGDAWKRSRLNKSCRSVQCLCICEVVKHPSVEVSPNPYWVIKNSKFIVVRFLFLYTHPPILTEGIRNIENEIRGLLLRQ